MGLPSLDYEEDEDEDEEDEEDDADNMDDNEYLSPLRFSLLLIRRSSILFSASPFYLSSFTKIVRHS